MNQLIEDIVCKVTGFTPVDAGNARELLCGFLNENGFDSNASSLLSTLDLINVAITLAGCNFSYLETEKWLVLFDENGEITGEKMLDSSVTLDFTNKAHYKFVEDLKSKIYKRFTDIKLLSQPSTIYFRKNTVGYMFILKDIMLSGNEMSANAYFNSETYIKYSLGKTNKLSKLRDAIGDKLEYSGKRPEHLVKINNEADLFFLIEEAIKL